MMIFYFSSGSVPRVGDTYWEDFAVKKSAHVFVYAILAVLNYRALLLENVAKNKAAFYSVLISFLYGVTDEIHQSFIPGREPKTRDVIIDTFGATVTIYLIYNYWDKFKKYILK